MNIDQLAADLFGKFAAHLSKQLSPLAARLQAVEARQPEKGADGQHGRDGVDGAPGRDGRDGIQGLPGEKGLDGRDGKDGANGRDGIDGLGFDDLSVEYDGVRGFTLRFVRGDQAKAFTFTLPVPVYRGVFKDGEDYTKSDTATWGGSVWIALKDTKERPGRNDDWQLMVKQGNEGKSAFAIAQERGFQGTKQEWVNSLHPLGETIVRVKP